MRDILGSWTFKYDGAAGVVEIDLPEGAPEPPPGEGCVVYHGPNSREEQLRKLGWTLPGYRDRAN